jgi:hypothetical protein
MAESSPDTTFRDVYKGEPGTAALPGRARPTPGMLPAPQAKPRRGGRSHPAEPCHLAKYLRVVPPSPGGGGVNRL